MKFKFPYRKREFVNETGGYLQVTLVVRKGQDPSKTLKQDPFTMDPGQKLVKEYGDAGNPFLNNIDVKLVVSDGDLPYAGTIVLKVGSPMDIAYNANYTVTFKYNKQSRVLALEMTNSLFSFGGVRGMGGGRALEAEPTRFEFTSLA
jgi:hypothetical protein